MLGAFLFSRLIALSALLPSPRRLFRSSIDTFLILFGIGIVGLGAYTRLTDSGLGCPDWPSCYGHWVVHQQITSPSLTPAFVSKAWIEMIHRYLAGCFGLFALLRVSYLASKGQILWQKATLLLCMIAAQASFGAFTVTWKLHPYAVVPHLLGGMAITLVLFLSLLKPAPSQPLLPTSLQTPLRWLTACMWVQIFLGGCTSAHYAAMICPNFPTCQGTWRTDHFNITKLFHVLPIGPNYAYGVYSASLREIIHMTHRLGAFTLTLLICIIVINAYRHANNLSHFHKRHLQCLVGFFSLQIFLGIANIVFQLPLAIAVGHNLTALALLLTLYALRRSLTETSSKHPPFSIFSYPPQVSMS